jgi:hypothetical protein
MNILSSLSGQFKKILQALFKPLYSFFTNSVVSEKNNSMQISFIIGAGFSAPDNYPTRKELNERLRKITHDEIIIHTDGSAWFLNGQLDPNADWTNVQEKLFVEKFLEYYTSTIIPSIENFDYESFFDFYQGLHYGRLKCSRFEEFADTFRKENDYQIDNMNLLGHFHNTFNQLIASQLMRWPKRVHLSKFYTKYPEFLTFIEQIRDSYDKIHFHTLNHDLLLEELSFSDAIQADLSDGFEELGSPFYSKNNDGLTIRLRRFTNSFTKKFCLYKLHGSIDQYVYNFKNSEYVAVKVPYGVSSNDLMKEYKNDKGELEYDGCFWNYYPDFLSGTTEKINSYTENHFYKPLFDHFIENLKNSNCLIAIGYGLGDSKINEFIKDNFLTDQSKTMIVITPSKPISDLLNFENVKYYGLNKGVQNLNKIEIDKIREI